jgi:predicted transcriptional regulator
MSLEIIRRKEGELSQKQEIRHEHTQFSINSYGHLCIREFDDPRMVNDCKIDNEGNCNERFCINDKCEHYKPSRVDDEHLIVLDQKTTNELIQFIFSVRSTYELKELLKGIVKTELPF